jgi:hypothetical protein
MVHKRSVDAKPQIHLRAFGKDISLSLKLTEGLLTANSLPMWTVTKNASQPDGLHYERVKDVSEISRVIARLSRFFFKLGSFRLLKLTRQSNWNIEEDRT